MQHLDWNDFRILLAVDRTGTTTGAGRSLGVDQTTVARHLTAMESAIGLPLFERSGSRMHPTEAGRSLLAHAERMEGEAEAAALEIAGAGPELSGTVRVTAVPVLVNHMLIPSLPGFLAAHPGIGIELIADPRGFSLGKREADIALRFARPSRESSVIARRVGTLAFAVYAASAPDADELPWICYEESMADLPQARWLASRVDVGGAAAGIRPNDLDGMIAAVRCGLGKSLLPEKIASPLHGIGKVADAAPPVQREVWMMVHPELRRLARIRTVMDWLSGCFSADRRSPS